LVQEAAAADPGEEEVEATATPAAPRLRAPTTAVVVRR